jgi:hypothetical protein
VSGGGFTQQVPHSNAGSVPGRVSQYLPAMPSYMCRWVCDRFRNIHAIGYEHNQAMSN